MHYYASTVYAIAVSVCLSITSQCLSTHHYADSAVW